MRVEAHELFERFVAGLNAAPRASVVHSLAEPPVLAEFLPDIDPQLILDWSGKDFYGLPSLRDKVLRHTGTGQQCSRENVLITAGTAEANFLAITQLVQAGDEIIVDVPGWPQPLVLAEAIGANIKRLERLENDRWRLDLGALEKMVGPKTRLIFICNPNNPTGQILEQDELKTVIDIAASVDAWVLSDEVYADLVWDGSDIPRAANLYAKGISTGSVSKSMGLQGLRTGWLICRDQKLLYDALVLREDTSEIMNIMGEHIADIALSDKHLPVLLERARVAGRHNLGLVDALISRHKGLHWHKPRAGLIGFCRFDYAMTSSEFADGLLKEPYNTFIMPGSAYSYDQHLRLGFGGKAGGVLGQGIAQLDNYLESLV